MEVLLGPPGIVKKFYVDKVKISTIFIDANCIMPYERRLQFNAFNKGEPSHITLDLIVISEKPERITVFVDSAN